MLLLFIYLFIRVIEGATRVPLSTDFNPYSTLRIPRNADKEAIKKAYKRALNVMGRVAAKGGHGQEANPADIVLMRSIRQSYELLTDPEWKAEWDAAHPGETSPSPGADGGWEQYERDL